MRIDLAVIMSKPESSEHFTAEIGFSEIDFAGSTYCADHERTVDIYVSNQGNRNIEVKLNTAVNLHSSCSRCLEDVIIPVQVNFADIISVNKDGRGTTSDKDDTNYIDEFMLDTDALILDEIYPQIPGNVLCRDNCKGLCPVCGRNLNDGICSCDRQSLDPRMAKILDVFNNFKEV